MKNKILKEFVEFAEKFDTILFILGLIIAGILLFGIANAYAGGVTDNNNCNLGDLFIGTGINNGANSIGTWKSITSIPELKGEKGDIGKQGIQGEKGNKGDIGDTGSAGLDGKNGENGKDGQKGDTGKGLKDRQEAQVELRILDTRKTTTSIYYIRDFNNQNNTTGIKFTIKLGKSYELRKLEELEARIKEIENVKTTKK